MNKLLILIFVLLARQGLQAQSLSNNQVLQQKDSAFFQTEEARRVGDQLLLYQRDTGGWPKNVDMVKPLSPAQQDSVTQQKGRQDDSTIDNKGTTMQMTYLARLYQQTGESRYRDAFRKAMTFLFNGQYDNGGWPQFWPKNRQYQVHITYNDNAIVNVLKIFRDVMKNRAPYDADLVDDDMRQQAAKAFNKGIDCILATQIVVDGEPTVWCQQHDAVTLLPAKARAYELPSFCTQESAEITFLLMQISKPDERIIRAVNGAMKWFEEHKITGYRLEKYVLNDQSPKRPNDQTTKRPNDQTTKRPNDQTTKRLNDVRLIADATAPPMWARYYDLEEGKPFFCDRDGQPKRSLAEIGYERRTGYSWYNTEPQDLYARYETWVKKNRITNRITFK